ncbi:MAG: exonuclease SbcCD subunit D C-terminal domain-containing protein [Bacillota bacterium]
MRILHTSDWHLGRTLEGRSRAGEQEAMLEEIASLVEECRIDMLLVAGDVFDAYNPPAAAEEMYYHYLERFASAGRTAVVVAAGNHDSPERIRAANPLAVRHGISLFGLPGERLGTTAPVGRIRRIDAGLGWTDIRIADEVVRIVVLPYPSEVRLGEVLSREMDAEIRRAAYSDRVAALLRSALDERPTCSPRLMMGHIYVAGGSESESERPIHIGGALTVDRDAIPPEFSYVALGHLHRPQRVGRNEKCRYSGSPLAFSFSETGDSREVVMVDLQPDGDAEVERIPLSCGRPLLRRRVRGWEELTRVVEDAEGAWLQVDVELDEPLSPAQLGELRRENPHVVIIRVLLPQSEAGEDRKPLTELSLQERFARFYAEREGGDPPEELVDLFLQLVQREEGEEQ